MAPCEDALAPLFGWILNQNTRWLSYIGRRLHHPLNILHEPEDVLQVGLCTASLALRGYCGTTAAEASAWFTGILRNEIGNLYRTANRLRRSGRCVSLSALATWGDRRCRGRRLDFEPSCAGSDPAEEVQAAETVMFLRGELLAPPRVQREVLVLFHLDGHTVGEVAGIIGMTECSVASHLARARRVLAARLRRRCAMEE